MESAVALQSPAMSDHGYQLLESGNGRKLERFGPVLLDRPATAAIWPARDPAAYREADARFDRDASGRGRWHIRRSLPDPWTMRFAGITWGLRANDFGHVGVFPEQESNWHWITQEVERCRTAGLAPEVLNLFGYTGGSTLAAATAGAKVCHVDASKTSVRIARENAERSALGDAAIRWIVEDAVLFVDREIRRGRQYHGVILDPPSYGRGRRGEVWQLEELVMELLAKCRQVMTENPQFLLFTGHSPGFTPLVLANLVGELFPGPVAYDEMVLPALDGRPLPSGASARWSAVGTPDGGAP